MSGYYPIHGLDLFAPPKVDERPESPAPALEAVAERDREWLAALRGKLRELYLHRKATWPVSGMPAYVCADDARRLCRQHPELRVPAGTSNNALGCVFRGKGWRRTGDTFSTQDGSHGNRIGTWIWEGAL
ncbi:MAG: hypothetical protein ABL993_02485 [Vicinamibacterales bacterium]